MSTDKLNIHPDTLRAIDHVDAAVFSGDCFFGEAEASYLLRMLAKWSREVRANRITEMAEGEK